MWKLFNHLSFTQVDFNSNSFELVYDDSQKKYFVNAEKIFTLIGFKPNKSGKVPSLDHLEKKLTIFPEIAGTHRFISVKNINELFFDSNGKIRSVEISSKLKCIARNYIDIMTKPKQFVKVDLSYNETINILSHDCQYTNNNGKVSISLNDLAKAIGYVDGLSFKASVLDTFSVKSDTKYGPTRFIPLHNFHKLAELILLRDRRHSLHIAYKTIMKKLKLNDHFSIDFNQFVFNSFVLPYIIVNGEVLIHSYSFLNYISMDEKCIDKPVAFKNAFLHDNQQYYVSLNEIEAFYNSTRNKIYKQRTLEFLSKRQRILMSLAFV